MLRTITLPVLILVVLLWISLSIGRVATARYLHKVGEAHKTYYRPYANAPEAASPTIWDFRRSEMVPLPSGSYEAASDTSEFAQFSAIVVEEGVRPAPFWVLGLAFGKRLLNVSSLIFHVVFAVLTLFLAWSAWKLRVG